MSNLLVVDPEPDDFAPWLRSRFPILKVIGARTFVEAEGHFSDTHILMTRGTAIDGVAFLAEHACQMPQLEWVQCLISGSEQVLRALEGRRDVLVTTAKGIHGPQMSELAIYFMLMLLREGPRMVRNQDAVRWERIPQRVLDQKTVGIVGLGSIGGHLARICKAFGMTVYGVSRSGRPVDAVDRVFGPDGLLEVAAEVDFLVLVMPATPETERVIGGDVLAAMKPTAYLINLARGQVVDEEALIDALVKHTIAGAGLDVFMEEPPPPTHPFWRLDNVLMTPHIGGASDLYHLAVRAIVEHNVQCYLSDARGDMTNLVRGASAV